MRSRSAVKRANRLRGPHPQSPTARQTVRKTKALTENSVYDTDTVRRFNAGYIKCRNSAAFRYEFLSDNFWATCHMMSPKFMVPIEKSVAKRK
ncbi:hypothetical protein CCR75_001867 [Bremia lactucae]|uniref:Uncharacterized protein n=1 Tax=Bremia lactucae TaxID=4779 RepID=A0A976FQA1_BRELC|nr:hypothetical protein CCR75_001867 [Bremia lactucae]